jgi:hypothetical protein
LPARMDDLDVAADVATGARPGPGGRRFKSCRPD